MVVRFWGVRGSIAVSGGAFVRTGGNTTCIELECAGSRLILDGGTGLQALGASLTGPVDATLLFSHLHWDHVQGVPFFAPAFHPGSRLRFVGPAGLEAALADQMRSPMFPIGLEAFNADCTFQEVSPNQTWREGPFTITASTMSHPDGVLVYRVAAPGRAGPCSVVFATDVEHGRSLDPALVSFCAGADLLMHDAQYTDAEYPARRGWGHSTWAQAVEVADAAGVGQLALIHHDPQRTDAAVAAIEAEAGLRRRGTLAAREGLEVAL